MAERVEVERGALCAAGGVGETEGAVGVGAGRGRQSAEEDAGAGREGSEGVAHGGVEVVLLCRRDCSQTCSADSVAVLAVAALGR